MYAVFPFRCERFSFEREIGERGLDIIIFSREVCGIMSICGPNVADPRLQPNQQQ